MGKENSKEKVNRYIWGFVFFILGVLGVILPILPGIPFFIVSGFLFGIIPEDKVIQLLKKMKLKDEKMAKWSNKLINFIILKYIHKRQINIGS